MVNYWQSKTRPKQLPCPRDKAIFTQKVKEVAAYHAQEEFVFQQKHHVLGKWLAKQRSEQAKLTPHRRKQLEDIGFCWSAKSAREKKEEYDRKQNDGSVNQSALNNTPPL